MAKTKKTKRTTNRNQKGVAVSATPRSLAILTSGIRTDKDFATAMSAMMGDLVEGTITPAVGNAVCKAGSNLLKAVELKYKYGSQNGSQRKEKTLLLTSAR